MSFEILEQGVELFTRDGFVVVPPDSLFRRIVANGELVLRGTSGVSASLDDERASRGKMRLATANGLFDQLHERPIMADC